MRKYDSDIMKMSTKHEKELEIVRREASEVLDAQLMLSKEESRKTMTEAIRTLELDFDEQIQALEYDLSWAKSQQVKAEENSEKLKSREEEAVARIKELKDEMNNIRIKYNFEKLFITSKALSLQNALVDEKNNASSLLNEVQDKHEQKEQELRKKIQLLEKQAVKYEQRMKLVTSTLLNHKRDQLLQHKTKSRAVAAQIKEVTDKTDLVNLRRDEVMNILSHMENEMKDVERRLQEHSKESALQRGGQININHARKKRRLDEE